MSYQVSGQVDIIAQPTSLVCWATVYTMMRSWEYEQSMTIRDAVAAVDAKYGVMVDNNRAMPPAEFAPFLRAAGMSWEPMANYTIDAWENMLLKYGLLWVGTMNLDSSGRHSRIIRGINNSGNSATSSFSIIDPAGGRQYVERFPDFLARYEGAFTFGPNDLYYQVRHW
jgi:hypothetical protein